MSAELSLEEFGKNFRNPQAERYEKGCPFLKIIELNEALIGTKAEELVERNKGDRNVFCHIRRDVEEWSDGDPQVPIKTRYVPERACRLTFVKLSQQLKDVKENNNAEEILTRWKNVISEEKFNGVYPFEFESESSLSDEKVIDLIFSYIKNTEMFKLGTFGCGQAPQGDYEEIPTDFLGQLP